MGGPKPGWGDLDPLKELGRGLRAGAKGSKPPQGTGAGDPRSLRELGRGSPERARGIDSP